MKCCPSPLDRKCTRLLSSKTSAVANFKVHCCHSYNKPELNRQIGGRAVKGRGRGGVSPLPRPLGWGTTERLAKYPPPPPAGPTPASNILLQSHTNVIYVWECEMKLKNANNRLSFPIHTNTHLLYSEEETNSIKWKGFLQLQTLKNFQENPNLRVY